MSVLQHCSVTECDHGGKLLRGYCKMHYTRFRRYGSPLIVRRRHGIQDGRSRHPLYPLHRNMLQRCRDTNAANYRLYGGRGIKVCERWQGDDGFTNFLMDMGERPSRRHTLDRIEPNGDYEPANCRWATVIEQNNNTRANHRITWRDRSYTFAELIRELAPGANRTDTLAYRRRLSLGWSIERTFTEPFRGRGDAVTTT